MSVPIPGAAEPANFRDDDSSIAPTSASADTTPTATYSRKDVPPTSKLNRLRGKVDRITSGVSRLGTAVATTWNPNHRHDEEHEKEVDARIEAIRDSHRFRSFAPEREDNLVKWHIDGHGKCILLLPISLTKDYFWALSELIDNAQDVGA